jgi:hypothetical protein
MDSEEEGWEQNTVSRNESASVSEKMEGKKKKQDGKPNQEITQEREIHLVLRQKIRTRQII